MESDEQLLGRAANGDREAFARFYRRHVVAITTYVRRRVDTPEVAFDLVAETFAAVVADVGAFDPARGSARGWLFGIARNQVRQAWRTRQVEDAARRRLALEPIVLDDAALLRVEELVDDGALTAALAALSDEERAAVQARIVDDGEYRDIAAALGTSESVVRQRVSRGLRRMRKTVEAKS